MDGKKLEIIKKLMEQLEGEMMGCESDAKEFSERIPGRKKPEGMAMIKIEAEEPEEMEDESESYAGFSGMGEGDEDAADILKKRVMKLRG